MPKEKPRMDEADVWFLNLYTGLAEPTPVEDGGHRHVEELPDADQVHEVVHDVSHPLYSMSVGVGNQGALVPKRFLNQENLASLWHVYELNKSDEPRVSRDTFTKAFNRHWKRILCFKGYGQGVRCQVCADFDERRSQLTSKKERQEIDELKQQLNRCDMDRSVNVRATDCQSRIQILRWRTPRLASSRCWWTGWTRQNFDVPETWKPMQPSPMSKGRPCISLELWQLASARFIIFLRLTPRRTATWLQLAWPTFWQMPTCCRK